MSIKTTVILAIAGFVFHFATTVSHAAPENIGKADRIKNSVTGSIAGRSKRLSRGDSVFQNQRIRTRSNSTAQIRFKDNTRLAVGANSSIVLDKAVFSGGSSEQLVLKAARGAFRFASGKLRKNAYKLVTPSSTVGIRGTMYDVYITPAGDTIITLLQGQLTACTSGGACRTIKDPCGCLRIDRSGNITSSTGLTQRILQGLRSSQVAPFLHFQSNLLRSIQAPSWLIRKCTSGSSTDGQDTDGSGGNGGDNAGGNGGGNGGTNSGGIG